MICPFYEEPLYFFFVPELSSLLYYSHIPAIIIALLAGLVVLLNDRKALVNQLLATVFFAFSVWTFCTLIDWTNIHSGILLFAWSFLGPAAGFISIFSIYFTYVFLTKKDVGPITKGVFILLLAPLIILAPSTYTLSGFNLVNCDAFGFEGLTNTFYFPALGALAMVWCLILLLRHYWHSASDVRKQIALMGTGLELFLLSFFTSIFLGQYLTTIGFLPDSQIETYGYFGMIVFAVYIGILIVRFKVFHVSLIASQALIVALLVLIGSQLTFVSGSTPRILVGITLGLTAIAGFVLVRSVRNEIQQRIHIERLARDLTIANEQQVTLIHFITHQIKGFITKSRNIFSLINEGETGPIPEAMKPMIEEGFRSDTQAAATIQEILNAANIRSGKVTYSMQSFDLTALVEEIVTSLKSAADLKGLILNVQTVPVTLMGDAAQLKNALKNLLDNSIKYTLKGSVTVSLTQNSSNAIFKIEDTGVGITPEDMKKLFTEGGHGVDSIKVNVESTGFGLYIVKSIIEAHKGKVWAESEGKDKGSRFIVELPVK